MKQDLASGTHEESVSPLSMLIDIGMTVLALCVLWLPRSAYGVGSWLPLNTQPSDNIGICLLLPDGTVLAEGSNANWWQLAPDGNGHYVNGQWSQRQSSTWGHQTGSTAVLQNGNVFVAGGENGNGNSQVEIYNTANQSWSVAVSPTYFGNIQDGNAMLLPNGQVLIEPQGASAPYGGLTFTFNPSNNQFSQTLGSPLNGIGEATWVKLANDNILVIDSGNASVGATTTELYNPATGIWQSAVAGGTVPNIWPDVTGTGKVSEMGPAFLLPNGNAIFFGGNGVTAIYNNGIWSQGATLPPGLAMKDAPGAMMVNGKILLAVCPPGTNSDVNAINGIGPTSFYEYDYTANGGAGTFTLTTSPGGGVSGRAEGLSMLDLPDGTVLLSGLGSQLYVYQPDTPPLTAGKPHINSVSWRADGTLHLTGTLFNGISQGASYGDNEQMDSNYPLVSFTDAHNAVAYGRTYNWTSTGVQKFGQVVATEVMIPPSVISSPGTFAVQVIANGIASDPVSFTVPTYVWADFNYFGSPQLGTFDNPFQTLAQAVTAVASGATIAIRADVQPSISHETMTISTPMTIISVYGPSTIGH